MKMLYILNIANKVNNFSYTNMLAAQNREIEFHIAGNWGYKNSTEKENDEKQYGIKIHQVDFIRMPYDWRNIKAYRQIVDIIEKEMIDIIHCNTPIGGVVGRLAGKRCGIKKVIYQAHGFHFYKGAPKVNWLLYYPVEKWLAHYTDILITINQEDYELAKSKFHLRRSGKVYYVPGVGIDEKTFIHSKEEKRNKRRELNIPEDAVLLISVGELNANKNNKLILDALGQLKNMKLHYILCGEGNKRKELEQCAIKLGIQNNIHFLGFRNDIKELYAASDIFVMPSYREGLSRSIMEAMASGLPCIVSNIRGNKDLIINNKQGYLCSPIEIGDFSSKILGLCNDSETRAKMSHASLKRIVNFSNDTVIKRYEEIYKDIVL